MRQRFEKRETSGWIVDQVFKVSNLYQYSLFSSLLSTERIEGGCVNATNLLDFFIPSKFPSHPFFFFLFLFKVIL